MNLKDIMDEKRKWKVFMARVEKLPEDYQIVYKEIQKYLFKVGPIDLFNESGLLVGIVEFFEEGAANGKKVLEITGNDVAAFCDELVKDSKTYDEIYMDEYYQKTLEKAMNEGIMEITVEVKDLKKSFKDNEVLKGVDFEVKSGEIFALLGSNGAGKTTIIKILSTLLKANEGLARVCNLDVKKQGGEVREKISLTGQFSAVDEVLTGKENLKLIAELRRVSNPSKIADELLERFGLSEAGDQYVSTYSGGMIRKLDIAMSLIGNPSVIFLDEPTTGLDPEARSEVWKTIKNLANTGTTIMLTTQYLEEAENLADKIAILNGGKIIANGSFEDLKKMFPPAKVEYVEKQPSLQEIFLSIVGKKEEI